MTACFTCDGPGCKAHGKQGTITGGVPDGWGVVFDVVQVTETIKGRETTRGQTHTRHYCPACREKRAGERTKESRK